MTRKDYEAMASAINATLEELRKFEKLRVVDMQEFLQRQIGIYHVVDSLLYVFEKDNPRFDRDKFKKACGL